MSVKTSYHIPNHHQHHHQFHKPIKLKTNFLILRRSRFCFALFKDKRIRGNFFGNMSGFCMWVSVWMASELSGYKFVYEVCFFVAKTLLKSIFFLFIFKFVWNIQRNSNLKVSVENNIRSYFLKIQVVKCCKILNVKGELVGTNIWFSKTNWFYINLDLKYMKNTSK